MSLDSLVATGSGSWPHGYQNNLTLQLFGPATTIR